MFLRFFFIPNVPVRLCVCVYFFQAVLTINGLHTFSKPDPRAAGDNGRHLCVERASVSPCFDSIRELMSAPLGSWCLGHRDCWTPVGSPLWVKTGELLASNICQKLDQFCAFYPEYNLLKCPYYTFHHTCLGFPLLCKPWLAITPHSEVRFLHVHVCVLSHFNCVWLFARASSVHAILQARVLGWVAMPSSRGSSKRRDQTRVSCFLHRQGCSLLLVLSRKPGLSIICH